MSCAQNACSESSRSSYSFEEIRALFDLPFNDLLNQAHQVHRENWNPNEIQISTLLNFKTGGCPENCSYCNQSAHFKTGLEKTTLDREEILEGARKAKASGASRFCMVAGWRGPRQENIEEMVDVIREVKAMGLETCASLGLLKEGQAEQLKDAGLDYYNHNIDTSPDFYGEIISTRTFEDRLNTLEQVQDAGIKTCCGGILGLGENRDHRARMLQTLLTFKCPPESVPINMLQPIPGTPLEKAEPLDVFEFIRTVAVARIVLPTSRVRLSAGRLKMSDEMQALCFFAGANSIHYGEKLLTTPNATPEADQNLFARLGIKGC